MAQLYVQRNVTPDSWDLSGAPATTVICLSVDATINYSDGTADTLPANTPAVLPDATTAFDRTHDVYVPYTVQGSGVLSIIKESLLPTLTDDYAPLARVELHGIKPYQPEAYLVVGGLGGGQESTLTALVSDTSAKALSLWTGSANASPPANWQSAGFDDSAWRAAVQVTSFAGTGGATAIAGTQFLWGSDPSVAGSERCLFRHSVSLPAGRITAAILQVFTDDQCDGLWLNGMLVPGSVAGSPGLNATLDVPLALLLAGASNLLAVSHANVVPPGAFVDYKLSVTYGGSGRVPNPGAAREGDVLYFHGGAWTDLPLGPSGALLTSNGTDPGWAAPATSGTVTSVQVAVPAPLASSGGPITSSGTITLAWASGQSANRVLASPDGTSGAVSLRALVGTDIPVDASTIISSAGTIKGNYQAGSGVSISGNTISATGSGGSVTSVALTVPGIFSVSGSPVTTSGTLAVSLATQSAHTVFAGPSSGSAAAPTFRALQSSDLPAAARAGGHIHAHGHFL